jgi:hypothetical protein
VRRAFMGSPVRLDEIVPVGPPWQVRSGRAQRHDVAEIAIRPPLEITSNAADSPDMPG